MESKTIRSIGNQGNNKLKPGKNAACFYFRMSVFSRKINDISLVEEENSRKLFLCSCGDIIVSSCDGWMTTELSYGAQKQQLMTS